jgi:hypothetical protein
MNNINRNKKTKKFFKKQHLHNIKKTHSNKGGNINSAGNTSNKQLLLSSIMATNNVGGKISNNKETPISEPSKYTITTTTDPTKDAVAATTELDQALDKPIEKTEGIIGNAVTDVKDGIVSVAETINKPFEGVEQSVGKVVTDIGKEGAIIVDAAKPAITELVVAAEEPLKKVEDDLGEVATDVGKKVGHGVTDIFFTSLSAVPGVGALMDLGLVANKVTKLVKETAEPIGKIVKTLSIVADKTAENIEKAEKIEHGTLNKKGGSSNKQGGKILKRIHNSIKQFENPHIINKKRANNTRRKYKNR